MVRPFQFLFLILSSCSLLTSVHAADLDGFAGHWRVDSIESNDGLEVNKDNLSLKLSLVDNGFGLEWKAPGGAVEKGKFVESESKPGVFSTQASSGGLLGFFSSEELNPLKGDPLIWARLDADSLIVYKLVIDEEGAFTLDRYENTLQGESIRLRFTRRAHGEPERSLVAQLKRTGG